MKDSTKCLRRNVIKTATVLCIMLSGCSEGPVDAVSDNARTDRFAESVKNVSSELEAVGIETEDLSGIDLSALTRSMDLAAAAEAMKVPPTVAKHGGPDRVIVSPGESIQSAIDAAQTGATIWIRPGTYEGPIAINKTLRLIGWPGGASNEVLIVPPAGGAANGIHVGPANEDADPVERVVLANMTVEGFDRNGVNAVRTDGIFMLRMTATNNGRYGLYPLRSTNGIIAHSAATGSADAGIYVGQSTNFLLAHNTASQNVIGIEISNCRHVAAFHNHAFNNTSGILAVLLPPSRFITFLEGDQLTTGHNIITDNNLTNFADGGFAAAVPAGSGILVVGYDAALVAHNRVTGNDFVGIAVGSTATFLAILGIPPEEIAAIPIDLDPDGARIVRNHVLHNGSAPSPLPGLPPADLLWDGTGSDNCWEKNKFETSAPLVLPNCDAV